LQALCSAPNQATVKFWNSRTFHDLVIVLSSLFYLQDVLEFYAYSFHNHL